MKKVFAESSAADKADGNGIGKRLLSEQPCIHFLCSCRMAGRIRKSLEISFHFSQLSDVTSPILQHFLTMSTIESEKILKIFFLYKSYRLQEAFFRKISLFFCIQYLYPVKVKKMCYDTSK